MDIKSTEIIKQYLQPSETLIWSGQPKQGILFEVADVFKTIYVLGFLVFIYFAIKLLSQISVLIAIPVGVVFFSLGFILGVGRFFIDAELKKYTFYGLTNKRIIIVSKMFPKKIQSVELNSKPKIDFLPNLDETATIDIGLREPTGFGRGGVSWFPNSKSCSFLYRIRDGDLVHRKIREIMN